MSEAEITVWYRRTDTLSATELDSIGSVLSQEEQARSKKFILNRDRRDFIAAHALARNALARCGSIAPEAWRFETDIYGKPVIIRSQSGTPPLSFNISHTHGLVACVIARGITVGIDVERINPVMAPREIAARYFAQSEIDFLQSCPGEEFAIRFLDFWTLKESYLKAIGKGLLIPLDSFAFSFHRNEVRFTPPSNDCAVWQFLLAGCKDHRLAVAATPGNAGQPKRIALHSADSDEYRTMNPL